MSKNGYDFTVEDMKEKEKEEKKTKTLTIIVSIAVALTLWIYVIGAVNPTTQTTVENVPVRLLNLDSLANRDLAIAGDGQYFVNVVVEGRRAEIGKMEVSEVEATADLIGFGLGDNYVRVNVTVPASVSVIDVKSSKILVTIDKLVAVSKPVQVVFGGAVVPDMEEGAVEVNPSEVEVSGAMSEVSRVKRVQVIVDTSDFSQEGNIVQGEVIAIDEAGIIVEGVRLSSTGVDVFAKLYTVKEVPVNIVTTGSARDGYTIVFSGPGLAKIKGSRETIKGISEIDTQPINLSGITSAGEIVLKLDLPKGVQLSKISEPLKAQVKVAPLKKKELVYGGDKVQIRGVAEGKKMYIKTPSVTLTVSGTEEVINGLKPEDIVPWVDGSGLSDGNHQVGIKLDYNVKIQDIAINPDKVDVIIEQEMLDNTLE
ncbi:MAG: YbbR-like domain-containing protein [Anaerovoracaceae bacterium]|jgi:YbbR domain-containing protein